MENRTPKPENLAKLTPEQRNIFNKWEAEHVATVALMERSLDALARGDRETYSECVRQLDQLVPSVCEHNVSIWEECDDCDEIWKTLFPEEYGFLKGKTISLDKKMLN